MKYNSLFLFYLLSSTLALNLNLVAWIFLKEYTYLIIVFCNSSTIIFSIFLLINE